MPLKPPASLKWASNSWVFWSLAVWVSFVFLFFFFNLYAGWTDFFPMGSSSTYLSHSTAFSQRLTVWKESFLALASGFLVMGILWSCGRRLFKWFSLEAPAGLRFGLELGLGLFLSNLFWMGLGLTRLWVEPLWLLGFILLTFLFLKDFLEIQRQGLSIKRPEGFSTWFLVFCLIYFVFLLLHSLLPETFYDSLNYFLGMPAYWLWNHGICDYPTHLLSGYFHGGSIFFLNGFVLAGTEGAKVLAALVLFWIALFCHGWAKEWAGPRAGAVAATAVITFPLLYLNSWAVRVDGLLTFVLLLFFYSIERGVSQKKRNWLVISGIFAGLALSIKPTAVVGIGAALLALLWRDGFAVLKRKGWFAFSVAVILGVGPWLLKNACFAGNAFFPYAISWMGGRSFSAWSYERLLGENRQFLPMDQGVFSVLTLPWRLTMPGAGDDQFIGPLLLAFLPLFIFLRFKDPALKFLGRTLFLSFVAGLTLSHMLRFSIPAFVLAFIILSAVLVSFKAGKWKILWTGALLASALLCVPVYLSLSANWFNGWGVLSGRESREHYLVRKVIPNYWMAQWVNANLPKDARLLVAGDAQVLYYRRPVYAQSVFDEQFFAAAARKEKGPAEIMKRLKELGITHVVFEKFLGAMNSKEYHQYGLRGEEWKKLDDFARDGMEPILDEKMIGLYRVRDHLEKNSRSVSNPLRSFQ